MQAKDWISKFFIDRKVFFGKVCMYMYVYIYMCTPWEIPGIVSNLLYCIVNRGPLIEIDT